MKKLINLFMALSIFIMANAAAPAAVFANEPDISGVYADIYGVTVSFASEVLAEELASVTLTEFVSKQEVSLGQTLSGDGLTLTLTPQDSGRLTPDIDYILSINGAKTGVRITTAVNMDFSDIALGSITTNNTALDGSTGKLTIITNASGRVAEIVDFSGDKKLFMRNNGGFGLGSTSLKDYTLSFKTELYATGTGQAPGRFFWHATGIGANTNAVNLYYPSRTTGRIDITGTAVSPAETVSNWITPTTVAATSSATSWEGMGTVTRMAEKDVAFKSVGNTYSAHVDGGTRVSVDVSDSKYVNAQKTGYFYHVANANCAELIDDVLLTTSSTFEVVDEVELEIDSIYADTQGIVLKVSGGAFEADAATGEVSLINHKSGQAAEVTAELAGDTIRLSAVIEPDALYTLNIPARFGEAFTYLGSDYIKSFTVKTVAANGFDSVSAGSLSANAPLDDKNQFAMIGVGQFAEIVNIDNDNKLFMAGAAVMTSKTLVSDYTVSFNTEVYGTSSVADPWYVYYMRSNSATGTADGYNLRPGYSALTFRNGSTEIFKDITYSTSQNWATPIRNEMVRSINSDTGTATTYAEMGITTRAKEHSVAFRAVGNEFSIFKDNIFIETASDSALNRSSGYFRIAGAKTSAQMMDNFLITEFVPEEEATVIFSGGLAVSGEGDDLSVSVKVANLAAQSKPYLLIITVRDERGRLIAAGISEPAQIASGGADFLPYSFEGVSGAVAVEAFLWDEVNTISPYVDKIDYEI